MRHSLKVIFGKEQVLKAYNDYPLNEEELKYNVKFYDFDTIEEKKAFIKGLNESKGWNEFCIPELEIIE